MADNEAAQDERLHELFRALREGVVQVPLDFSRRVGAALGELSHGWEAEHPRLSSVVGKLVVETFNLLGSPFHGRETPRSDEREGDDGRRGRE